MRLELRSSLFSQYVLGDIPVFNLIRFPYQNYCCSKSSPNFEPSLRPALQKLRSSESKRVVVTSQHFKMSRNGRVHSASSKRFKAPPYRKNCTNSKQKESENLLGPKEDVMEWEEARCPICMEHPHSAVLLRCSSSKNGCRPYMCNTGFRHSNCLNEFFNKFSVISSTNEPQELPLSEAQEVPLSSTEPEEAPDPPSMEPEELNWSCGNQSEPKLECPLCRGQITGWVVVEPARRFMNAKSRSCSYGTCDYIGTYPELRKHARLEHPSVRPWEVDQKRNRDWKLLEYTREIQDVLSVIQSDFIDFSSGEINVTEIDEHWVTLTFVPRST